MKRTLFVFSLVLILIGDALCQQLEAYILGQSLKKVARVKHKIKTKDKKAVKYGVGAAVMAVKAPVQTKAGKPLKLIGLALGPLGLPYKAIGGTLKGKAVANIVKSGVLTVKKLSRDSVQNSLPN